MNNTIKIVAVVAVIVVVAAAAFVLIGGNDDDGPAVDDNKQKLSEKLESMRVNGEDYPARLMILGNANCDDYLDEKDVDVINDLIAKGYDYTKDFMADANYDGVIDEKDVDYVKELMKDDYNGIANYVNCDYKIRSYNMGHPLKLANILTQTLEMECILAPEAVVATDYRAGDPDRNGGQATFWKEFASVIDYDKLGNIGNHKTPNAEELVQVAREYGDGYLTVWFNSQYANSTGYLEEALEGTNVQILRLPSWENGSTVNGILTGGFLFHKNDVAQDWAEWYDGWMDQIMEKVASLNDSQKLKVLGSYLYTSEEAPDGEYYVFAGNSGEYQNLLRLGIVDVVTKAEVQQGSSWKVQLSDEAFAEVCKSFGCDLMVGTVPGPYGAVTADYIREVYDERLKAINEYADGEVDLVVFGWIYASGPMELIFLAAIGNYMYDWNLPLDQITNESLQWMHNYGTGEYQYTYDTIKDLLFYSGE